MCLAGRAAEELIYGRDEMSTINQRRIVMARRIVTKLVVSGAMREAPAAGPRTLSVPQRRDRSRLQIVPKRVGMLGTSCLFYGFAQSCCP